MNMGHIHLKKGNYASAVQFYENCSSRYFKDENPSVLSYLARAYYLENDFVNAKKVLEKVCVPVK
jgi:outer membrane protein assembly factor BamD (BamD/ComL family)